MLSHVPTLTQVFETAAVPVIVQILAGDEAVFAELRAILGTWYCMLISILLYTNPTVQATDLQYHAHVRSLCCCFLYYAYIHVLISSVPFRFAVLNFVDQAINQSTSVWCHMSWATHRD